MAVENKLTRSLGFPLSLVLTDARGNPCGKEPALTCTREGEETAVGRPAVKWRVVQPDKEQKTHTAAAWVDPKLGTLVRFSTENGEGFEVRDQSPNRRASSAESVVPVLRRALSPPRASTALD